MAGDHVYIFVPDRYPRLLDRLFASRAEVDPEDDDFFGAFAVDPARPAADLEAAYGAGPERSRAEADDRRADARSGSAARPNMPTACTLGPIELIVRDVDEKGTHHVRRPVARAGRAAAAHAGLPQRRRDRRPAARLRSAGLTASAAEPAPAAMRRRRARPPTSTADAL